MEVSKAKFICIMRSCSVLELSGDKMPEKTALNAAHLLISTPEKWDGITRYDSLAKGRIHQPASKVNSVYPPYHPRYSNLKTVVSRKALEFKSYSTKRRVVRKSTKSRINSFCFYFFCFYDFLFFFSE